MASVTFGLIGISGGGKGSVISSLLRSPGIETFAPDQDVLIDLLHHDLHHYGTAKTSKFRAGTLTFNRRTHKGHGYSMLPGANDTWGDHIVDVVFVDTRGGDFVQATLPAHSRGLLLELDLLIVVIDPHTVFGVPRRERDQRLGAFASRVRDLWHPGRGRTHASVAVALTKCDEYGMPYDRMGRLINDPQTLDRLSEYIGERNNLVPTPDGAFADAVRDEVTRRFETGPEQEAVFRILGQLESFWAKVFSGSVLVGEQLNVYFTSPEPKVGGKQRDDVRRAVGVSSIFRDFFARIARNRWKGGSWPYGPDLETSEAEAASEAAS